MSAPDAPPAAGAPGAAIGFVGLGVLGSAVAANIAAAGYAVHGVDPDPQARAAAQRAGIVPAPDLADAGAQCPVIFTCLPSAGTLAEVSRALADAPLPEGGQVIVEMSTLAVADKEAARDILAAGGRRALDCPVSGNRIMALERGLTAFCSGARDDYSAIRPVLETFCRKTHFVGPFGHGSKTKFCGNILNLVHNTVAAEAMVLAMKSGLDPEMFHEVISGSGSSSAMFEVRGALMAQNDYAREGMNFSVPLKDAPIIAEHAARMGVPIPLYQLAVQYYHAASAQGLAHLDAAAVCRVMERAAGCERPSDGGDA